jgi:hypothetical protein
MITPGRKPFGPGDHFCQSKLRVRKVPQIVLIGKNGGEPIPHDIDGLSLIFRPIMGLDEKCFRSLRHRRINLMPAAFEKLMSYGFPNALLGADVAAIIVLGAGFDSKHFVENDPKQGVPGTRIRCEPNDHESAAGNPTGQADVRAQVKETRP